MWKAMRNENARPKFDDSDMTKIITIYEPDPNEWIEFRKRGSHV